VTAVEVYELTTQGGASDFRRLIEICGSLDAYSLIGGLAVNCYVEPLYTLDAVLVFAANSLSTLTAELRNSGFNVAEHEHSLNAIAPASELRIQFTMDDRYQAFMARAVEAEVLGIRVRVASLEDVTQGKLWAYSDPKRRLSKRKKDELDLIRLAEAYPDLKSGYPRELVEVIERG
jgi:hypothetical protein